MDWQRTLLVADVISQLHRG